MTIYKVFRICYTIGTFVETVLNSKNYHNSLQFIFLGHIMWLTAISYRIWNIKGRICTHFPGYFILNYLMFVVLVITFAKKAKFSSRRAGLVD